MKRFVSLLRVRRIALPLLVFRLVASTAELQAQVAPLPRKLPPGFESVIFAEPPMINYPTFLCPGEAGELFVSVDKNGSIDTKPDRGFIVKLTDVDGDGKADTRVDFAKVTSPRGLAYDGEWLYCLHPPTLTRYRDANADGLADQAEDLVTGVGFDLSKRPPDHTSNGVTLAIDGWLYLAIGDFGFMKAKGTDGRTLQLHGGGVVRVRPDGSELELFCRGTRNIYEVAVDPWLNVFARDNTNDGGGWDLKVHALFYGAEMGYPSLFKNFADETMPTLGIYGGGSGTGCTYIQEPTVPAPFGDMLYTADWGRNAIYYHPRKGEKGAWFDLGQETFCEIQRPTDLKVDTAGNIFIASWKGGEYTYKGENVGYIALVRAPEAQKKAGFPKATRLPCPPVRELAGLTESQAAPTAEEKAVYSALSSSSLTTRLMAEQHVLRTRCFVYDGPRERFEIDDPDAGPIWINLAVLGDGKTCTLIAENLERAPSSAAVEYYLRALADFPRLAAQLEVPTEWLLAALDKGKSDRVKTQAIIALSRLGRKEAGPELLAIAAQAPVVEDETSIVVEPRAATANVKGTAATRLQPLVADITGAKKLFLVVTDGGDGNRLDYADWVEPLLTGPAGEKKLTELSWAEASAGWSTTRVGKSAIDQPLSVDAQPVAWGLGTHAVSVIAYELPQGHGWTQFSAKGALDDASVKRNSGRGSVQFHVYVDALPLEFRGESRKHTELATDGRRSMPHLASRALISLGAYEACFAALDTSASDAGTRAAALRVLRHLHLPEVVTGLMSRAEKVEEARLRRGLLTALIRLYFREAEWDGRSWGTRPDTAGPYYQKAVWSESDRIEAAVRAALARATQDDVAFVAAQLRRHGIRWKELPGNAPSDGEAVDPQWAKDQEILAKAMARAAEVKPGAVGLLDPSVAIERTLGVLGSGKADAKRGEQVFTEQGCAACHAVQRDAAPKGPNLFDIAKRYQPSEILTSVIHPSATVAQGFPTSVIETNDGQTHAGFIIRESGEEIVLRNMAALTQVIRPGAIKTRRTEAISSMTPGLVNNLQPEELAGLVEFLRSLQ